MSNRAWVTLATNDSYGLGALVLAHSLRRAGSAFPAVVLITPSVTEAMRARLGEVFAEVIIVDVLDSGDAAHLALLQRPELGITFTKLHCWNLTQYEKCVFLDADTLVIQNCDELFDREEFSAAPDVGWPDCFNSGVFVFKPSVETFSRLVKFAQERGSFDGGDQGLLNLYFSDWAHGDINKHLPFLYNVTSAAFYSYLPALKQYGQNLKIIHFIGATKPWLQHYNWRTRSVEAPEHQRDFLQLWWSLFVAEVHSKLDLSMVEMEESPIADPQDEPEYAAEVLNTGHYEATLNPHSEFPWHHPENQTQHNREDEPTIDMQEYHDPWNIYRGHIPPINNDNNQHEHQKMDHQEVRKYAWEYMPPSYDENLRNQVPSQVETPFMDQSFQDTHYTTHNENFTSPHTETYYNTNEHRQEYVPTDQNSQQNLHENFHTEYVHHTDYHEPYSKPHDSYHCEYQHNEASTKKSTDSIKNKSKPSSHTYHDDSKPDNLIVRSENTHRSDNVNFNATPKTVTFKKSQEPVQTFTPYVYSVHLDYNKRNHENDEPMVNGYVSDDECDTYEDVLPRHPYDGFYLRHRNTIDSRGRKICSHEIPYLHHSPTPSPPASPELFEDALDFPEETNEVSGENNTGVAGHLARIGEDLQSGAIDELIRRQGWESGNIDYMGADSFDNIWAKISQTLNQSPSSPPAVTPSAPSPIQGNDSSSIPEPLPVPVETAEKEEPLPVPVEKDTEKLATIEPLPAPAEIDSKNVDAEVPLPGPVETDTKVLAQTESLPVQAETDTKNLLSEEPVPEALEQDTNKVPPKESVPVSADPKQVALNEPVPLPVEAETKEVSPQVTADKERTECDTKTLPTELCPEPIQTDTKVLPSEVSPEPIKADKRDPLSEVPPLPTEADNKVLPSEVPSSPVKPDNEKQLAELPSLQAAEPKKEEKSIPESIKPTASPSEPSPQPAEPNKEEKSIPEPIKSTACPSEPSPLAAEPNKEEKSIPEPIKPTACTSEPSSQAAESNKDEKSIPEPDTPTACPSEPSPQTAEPTKEEKSIPEPNKPTASPSEDKTEIVSDVPVSALEALKLDEKKPGVSDSPPLATTPTKEEATTVPAAKSEERRKPSGKLQLHPPAAADPLPTPDSELEDAATLAQSIIAIELRTPTVTSPSPTTEPPPGLATSQPSNLGIKEPEVPTPPVGAVSLTQIGIKPKAKPSIAAQIESSISPKTESTPQTPVSTPSSPSEVEAPKKKLVKKATKKEKEGASSGEAPVPPPRKKEKKPKDK